MTVLELLDEDNLEQLHAAGRLDIDTTGLVLLTDDGQWSHRITAPRSQCRKTYYVETADPIAPELVALFKEGVQLKGEMRPTLPADLVIIHEQAARLTLQEGKYHQVKRMFAFAGNRVELLHREAIGPIALDDDLEPGQYRALTAEEIAAL
jgi:16S rRNA pseudouridine516 synthase